MRSPASPGLFSTRGYNIESLSVAATDDPSVSRVTLVTQGADGVILQIVNQLNKLIDVVAVEDLTRGEHIERELVVLKLRVEPQLIDSVRGYVVRAGGRVLEPSPEGFVVELTASEAEVNQFVTDLGERTDIVEVVRSGALAVGRNARAPICVSLNDEVVHGIPSPKRRISDGDLIGLDIGCIWEGWHADCARTFAVGAVRSGRRG